MAKQKNIPAGISPVSNASREPNRPHGRNSAMKPMLPWYTLNEGAGWISEKTECHYGVKDLLAAGYSENLKLKFQVPSGATFWERIGHEKIITSSGHVLALEFSYIYVLMERGTVNISAIDGDANPGAIFLDPKRPTSNFSFDPHINIVGDDVRIERADLERYATTLLVSAGNDETPRERAKRLQASVNDEKAKGSKCFNKTVAAREGITTARLDQILKKSSHEATRLDRAKNKPCSKRR